MKKKLLAEIFEFLNVYYSEIHLIKALNSLDSSKPHNWLLKIQKIGGSRKLFMPENDFQTCFKVNFSKKYPDFGGLKTNRPEFFFLFQFNITCIWTQYNIKISAISFKGNILK